MTAAATGQLSTATLEQAGVTQAALDAFYSDLARQGVQIDSFMLLCREGLAQERYWFPATAQTYHPVYSVTKSITAVAIGLLESVGLITGEDKILDYFPEYRQVAQPNADRVSIRHLLTMTCGHKTVPSRAGADDWIYAFFTHPFSYEPGQHFLYNALSSYMLTALIRRVSGKNLTDYLYELVFAPLGIEKPPCDCCPRGIQSGAGGLSLRTADMAKLALLLIGDGLWNGRQLLPSGWVRQASAAQICDPARKGDFAGAFCAAGYGFQMWPCAYRDAFRLDGAQGQYAFITPSLGRILVTTAHDPKPRRILAAFLRWLLPPAEPAGILQERKK